MARTTRPSPRLLTLEEYQALPDDGRYRAQTRLRRGATFSPTRQPESRFPALVR